MRNIIRLIILTLLILIIRALWQHYYPQVAVLNNDSAVQVVMNEKVATKDLSSNTQKTATILNVPFVSEAPEGVWTQPWANACEEASMAMIEKFYQGYDKVSILDAKNTLQNMFDEQDRLFGSNRNADASQILEILNLHNIIEARIVTNPTLEQIKSEIIEGRPVLSLHFGFDLQNQNIGFSPTLSSYHTIVVVGFDDDKGGFITHDPGDEDEGQNHFYSYDIFMNSLHDYDAVKNKADGVPTAIFTNRK